MDIRAYAHHLTDARTFLAAALDPFPAIGVIAGTGLGELVADMHVRHSLAYKDIPHFPVSTVPGHEGRLVSGVLGGSEVVVLRGRFHLYEGYTPHDIAFPIRVLAGCGLGGLVITNAAGGLDPECVPGDIMVIRDHLNMTGENPLVGAHDPDWGERFPDMSALYDRELQDLALNAGRASGAGLRHGVYVGVKGPCLETPAETRFFRLAGGDAIGMSTVQEAIAAHQAGLRILGLSVITNVNIPDHMAATSLDDVLTAAGAAAPRLRRLVAEIVRGWPKATRS